MHYEIWRGDDGWRWRLRAANGEVLCSGEAYEDERDAERAVELLKSSEHAPVQRL